MQYGHATTPGFVDPAAQTPVLIVTETRRPAHLTRNVRERCVMARAQKAGLRFYRCFALAHYSTWESAEAAARLWLRPILARLSLLPSSPARLTARNRSGVVGVHFRAGRHVLKSGRPTEYPAFVARWPGSTRGVKWMFRKSGGEDGAFLRACLSRELRTSDRVRVEWALRALPPERRAALLACKHATPKAAHPPELVATAAKIFG